MLVVKIRSSQDSASMLVEAGLIRIYHRYRPKMLEETLNQSSSMIEQASQAATDELDDSSSTIGRGIEYSSPMKRIMELIGQHSPVIVVSSSDSAPESAKGPDESPTGLVSGAQSVLPTHHHQQAVNLFAAPTAETLMDQQQQHQGPDHGQQQHWTLLDSGQMLQPMQLAAQQQQIIQSTVPYEQYYFGPTHLATDNAGNQITVLPAPGLGAFSAPNSYRQVATTLPYAPLQAIQSQQTQLQPHQPHLIGHQAGHAHQPPLQDDRTQPVFLSSYVPEIPAGQQAKQVQPFAGSLSQLVDNQQPNSIQQIQQAQQAPPSAAKTEPEESLKASKASDDANSNDVHDTDSNGNDSGANNKSSDDEDDSSAAKTKRQSSAPKSDDRDVEEPSSGSMTYEDKYDSDKDDQANQPKSSSPAKFAAEPSTVINGLVNVGLNDDCLQCICRASSGCDHLLRCITRGSEEKYCGPFQLTEEYWNMAGSPGDAANNFQSFEDCANEADCAVETVTNYMKKYHKDCDGDENITCMDYARLHRLKPSECDNTEKLANDFDAYWAKFQRCAESYNRSRNGDDEDI